MESIFSKVPDLPTAPIPEEIQQAIFGKSAVPEIVEPPPQNPWLRPTGASEIAADDGGEFNDPQEFAKSIGLTQPAVTPSTPSGKFPIRFSKKATPAPDPTTPTVKPKLKYEKATIDGTLWNQGFNTSGELVSMYMVYDEIE